jgi:nucleotide-binding universal stress UspA family protein
MTKHILVAYDGSAPAEKAFDFALGLAQAVSADLYVLAVARPPEPPEEVETAAVLESAKEYFEQRFSTLRQRLTGAQLAAKFEVAVGHPAEQIVYQAEKQGIDHIVMGHRGNTFFRRWLLGSVSKQVIDHAHCTVTVVR